MKKILTAAFLCLFMLAVFAGCREEEAEPTLPAGVIKVAGAECYIIQLPAGRSASDYFSLYGGEGTVCVERTDVSTFSEYEGTVYNRRVEQGGWVAYTKDQAGDLIMYIPEAVGENYVVHAASRLLHAKSGMTTEEAKAYIPWMR